MPVAGYLERAFGSSTDNQSFFADVNDYDMTIPSVMEQHRNVAGRKYSGRDLKEGHVMYVMPAEWELHERTWMAWPAECQALGDTDEDAHAAYAAWANVANAIAVFEPVSMLVDPSDIDSALEYLDPGVEILQAPLNDAWMRDIGPTFVRAEDGSLAAVDWIFNGWGAQNWAKWDKDSQIGKFIAEHIGVNRVPSTLTNEGGGIHVNGLGVVLLTETVQRDPHRNPGLSRQDVEAELARTIGARRFVWLSRGLTRDYDTFGTRGHVDIVACFVSENTVLFHDQQNPEHPDYAVSREVEELLRAEGFTVIGVPAPNILQDEGGHWVDYSYINHYVVNGGVILCGFEDPGDDKAVSILQSVYPDRQVVVIDAREIFARGGGIHCITQQQPKVI